MKVSLAWEDWERLARIGNVASGDGARPILSAIFIEAEVDDARVRATATDSYKLATVSVPAEIDDDEPPILMPARAARTITTAFRQLASIALGSKWADQLGSEKTISITYTADPRPQVYVEFNIGARHIGSLATDLVDGKYPNYRALLHKPDLQPYSRSTLARKRKDEIADYIAVQFGRTYNPETNSKDSLLDAYDDLAAKSIERSIGLAPDHLSALMRTTTTTYPHPLRIEMFGQLRPIFLANPSDKDWQGIQMPVRT